MYLRTIGGCRSRDSDAQATATDITCGCSAYYSGNAATRSSLGSNPQRSAFSTIGGDKGSLSSSQLFPRLPAREDNGVPGSETRFGGSLLRQQLSQDKRQNPAVAVIIDLDRRIDAKLHWHGLLLSVFAFDLERYILPRFD